MSDQQSSIRCTWYVLWRGSAYSQEVMIIISDEILSEKLPRPSLSDCILIFIFIYLSKFSSYKIYLYKVVWLTSTHPEEAPQEGRRCWSGGHAHRASRPWKGCPCTWVVGGSISLAHQVFLFAQLPPMSSHPCQVWQMLQVAELWLLALKVGLSVQLPSLRQIAELDNNQKNV